MENAQHMESGLSPPSRGAWIEIREKTATALYRLSPPSRGAWIEIKAQNMRKAMRTVAPLAGGVD